MKNNIIVIFILFLVYACDPPVRQTNPIFYSEDEPKSGLNECNCGEIEWLGEFSDGRSKVSRGDCDYYLNTNGELAIQDTFLYAGNFHNGRALVSKAGENQPPFTLIDTEGKTVLEITTDYDDAWLHREGKYIEVEQSELQGVLNLKGEVIIPLQKSSIYIFGDRALGVLNMKETDVYNLITGEILAHYQGDLGNSGNGFMGITKLRDNFFINQDGEEVFEHYQWAGDFSEGLAKVMKYGSTGFIDTLGNTAIPFGFHDHGYDGYWHVFSEGLCAMSKSEGEEDPKYGFINKKGELVIPYRYDECKDFEKGLAVVELDGKEGVIDRKGNWVSKPLYEDIWIIEKGLYWTWEANEIALFNNEGKQYRTKYEAMTDFVDGKALGLIRDEIVIIDIKEVRAFLESDEVVDPLLL